MAVQMLLMRIKDVVESSTYGGAALKVLIDAVQATVSGINGVVNNMEPIVNDLGSKEFNSMMCLPAGASPVTATGDGVAPWADGAWVQLTADIGAGVWIVDSADLANFSGADDFEIDIGTGAPAAEVVIGTVAFNAEGQHRITCTPIFRGGAPTEVSVRIRSAVATPKTVDVKLNIIPS